MATTTKEAKPAGNGTGTSLAIIPRETYLALRSPDAQRELAEAWDANAAAGGSAGESLFLRVKTPSGGATTWDVDGEPAKVITGILVWSFPRGVLWPSDEVKEGTLPALRTDDLVTARQVGEMPDAMRKALEPYALASGGYDWQRLTGDTGPYGWGTGKGGHGKAAKEQRVLFVLREGDMLPIVVTIGPGSLKNYPPLLNALTRHQIPCYRAIVSLSLEKAQSEGGTTYSRIVLQPVGQISREDGLAIKTTYTDKLAAMVKGMAVDAAE